MIIIFIAFCARRHQGVRSMIPLVSTETDVRLHTYNWPSMTKDVTLGGVADLFVTNFIIAACSSNHKDFNLKSSFAYYKYTITQESESLSISTWYQ